jgi:drug/metabolite transporter (DMT)-like permease
MTRSSHRPATWAVILAFAVIYVSWGTTYLAIREGVHNQQLPPALFGGTRITLAGWILLFFVAVRGDSLRFSRHEFRWIVLGGLLLFVGGNGLITVAERTVESGIASVLAATTPLWLALLEMCWPRGERLALRGWLGLLLGLGGVLVLLAPKLHDATTLPSDPGPLLVLGSALVWSLGSLVARYHRPRCSHLVVAAYQMIIGGSTLALLGLLLGEGQQLTADRFTSRAWFAFSYLLIVGSLLGFVAFNWLLGHVSATLVGTYAYVNPLIAIMVGWLLGGEDLTARIIGGMVIILSGVALVRMGHEKSPRVAARGPRNVVQLAGKGQSP